MTEQNSAVLESLGVMLIDLYARVLGLQDLLRQQDIVDQGQIDLAIKAARARIMQAPAVGHFRTGRTDGQSLTDLGRVLPNIPK